MKWLLTVVPVVVFADQITKWLIRQKLALNEKVVLIDGFLDITHVQNPGAAFGLFRDMDPMIRIPLFYVISLVAFVIMIYLFIQTSSNEWRLRGIIALILGGAIGNNLDRIVFTTVTDFITVYYKSFHWPSFNVADSCITVGVILLLIELLFINKYKRLVPGQQQQQGESIDHDF